MAPVAAGILQCSGDVLLDLLPQVGILAVKNERRRDIGDVKLQPIPHDSEAGHSNTVAADRQLELLGDKSDLGIRDRDRTLVIDQPAREWGIAPFECLYLN